jgi:hypothetical protein
MKKQLKPIQLPLVLHVLPGVCAIAYNKAGYEHDRCYSWETAQTMANEGYRLLAVADDGYMKMDDIQAMVDYELKIALDCFGEDHQK